MSEIVKRPEMTQDELGQLPTTKGRWLVPGATSALNYKTVCWYPRP